MESFPLGVIYQNLPAVVGQLPLILIRKLLKSGALVGGKSDGDWCIFCHERRLQCATLCVKLVDYRSAMRYMVVICR